eukprot:CAMPEP_0202846208 /NCGR_PEP_ID=MMETSP1389-20130828/72114_1 /ASSEMBLY_ACC=CAM_ASM_000865 /TAXON_ID=302021 /ORGANISM="Rhodomonas sp., Strain CCMP768" /LENGTH=69 /DNA_ID=CAMNT_0049523751 /DNA_START=15 /DNA_END=220 /DNA_ORIENTATION=-
MKAKGISPDRYSYNVLLNVCAKSARARTTRSVDPIGLDQGMAILNMMRNDGLDADVVTYTALLDTCLNS